MSAIITGSSCKKCKRKYYLSLGHPKWYDDVIKRGMSKSDNFLAYEKLCKSGMCPSCFVNKGSVAIPSFDKGFLIKLKG